MSKYARLLNDLVFVILVVLVIEVEVQVVGVILGLERVGGRLRGEHPGLPETATLAAVTLDAENLGDAVLSPFRTPGVLNEPVVEAVFGAVTKHSDAGEHAALVLVKESAGGGHGLEKTILVEEDVVGHEHDAENRTVGDDFAHGVLGLVHDAIAGGLDGLLIGALGGARDGIIALVGEARLGHETVVHEVDESVLDVATVTSLVGGVAREEVLGGELEVGEVVGVGDAHAVGESLGGGRGPGGGAIADGVDLGVEAVGPALAGVETSLKHAKMNDCMQDCNKMSSLLIF